MTELVAPLTHLLVRGEDAVHRARRAEIRVFIEELGVDLSRCLVGEALGVEHSEHLRALVGRGSARSRAFSRRSFSFSIASGSRFLLGLRPRFAGVRPASSPLSRCLRHATTCDE
jgi:hypothetical protein